MDGDGGYVGQLSYDFEQYGRMVYDDDSNVSLSCVGGLRQRWLIQSTGQTYSLVGFAVFMNALNHYLFKVLQFDPVSQWSKVSEVDYEYYFERVYFDMGTREFMSAKKLTVPTTAESSHRFLKANIRS